MEDDQQFCLRWNNHQSTLISVFDTLLEKGIHVDCTLAAEGQTLRAHKVVLSACSPYFENVLSQQYDKHPIIILKDVKYAELRAMMDYMYRGEVNISQDQLAALLKAAESLQIKGLSDNKPARPPNTHPPRSTTPVTKVRDGSVDSREGSTSPTRRRKKARRASTDGLTATTNSLPIPVATAPVAVPVPIPVPVAPAPPADEAAGGEPADCKVEEGSRGTDGEGVEDLTLDEENEEPPAIAQNDVVRNFQWHMERSQEEMMNTDGARDSQGSGGCGDPDVSFTRIGGLSWEQWSARLALPLAASMRIGASGNLSPGEQGFACPDCGRVYKLKSSLRNHQKWECGKEPQFQCPYCVYRAKQKMHIARHMERMHREAYIKPEPFIKQDNVDACT